MEPDWKINALLDIHEIIRFIHNLPKKTLILYCEL